MTLVFEISQICDMLVRDRTFSLATGYKMTTR